MSEELDPLDEREAEQKEVADARLIEELSADDQLKQLQRILQDENVRDFLWRFLVTCNIYQTVANNNFGTMCLQEGRRQAGLQLLAEICDADPTAEMKMRRKSIDASAQRKRDAALKSMRRKARSNSTNL